MIPCSNSNKWKGHNEALIIILSSGQDNLISLLGGKNIYHPPIKREKKTIRETWNQILVHVLHKQTLQPLDHDFSFLYKKRTKSLLNQNFKCAKFSLFVKILNRVWTPLDGDENDGNDDSDDNVGINSSDEDDNDDDNVDDDDNDNETDADAEAFDKKGAWKIYQKPKRAGFKSV